MAKGYIAPVMSGQPAWELGLQGLEALRQDMQTALEQRDWSALQRLDRLCGQAMERLDVRSQDQMVAAMELLVDIKRLYARALNYLHREMGELASQAL